MVDRKPSKAIIRRWQRDIVRHLEDFPRQYAALESAMGAFGVDFDLQEFKDAFNTAEDMEAYNRVQAVERAAGRVQNFVAELAVAATKLAGLTATSAHDHGSSAQEAFEALRDVRVIDAGVCRRLVRAQNARSMIEHSHVQTPAGDVHRAAQLIFETAHDFIRSYRAWIGPYIEDVTPPENP